MVFLANVTRHQNSLSSLNFDIEYSLLSWSWICLGFCLCLKMLFFQVCLYFEIHYFHLIISLDLGKYQFVFDWLCFPRLIQTYLCLFRLPATENNQSNCAREENLNLFILSSNNNFYEPVKNYKVDCAYPYRFVESSNLSLLFCDPIRPSATNHILIY